MAQQRRPTAMRCLPMTVVAAFSAYVALSAYARTEFTTTVDGKRVGGSEVCFFRSEGAELFARKYLASPEVHCVPADDVLDLPVGSWNVFAVNGSGYVSSHPHHFTSAGATPAYHSVEVTMRPSGIVDVSRAQAVLKSDERFLVYIANAGMPHSPASVQPLRSADATEFAVPAGEQLQLLVVRGRYPVAVSDPFTVEAGERRVVSVPPKPAGAFDVIAHVRLRLSDELWLAPDDPVESPRIELRDSEGAVHLPAFSLRPGRQVHDTIAVFRNVKPGKARITLSGPVWKEAGVDVDGEAGAVALLEESLIGTPAADVRLSWTIDPLAASVRDPEPRCEATGPAMSDAKIRIRRCEGEPADGKPCELVREETVTGDMQELRLSSLSPGRYVAELEYPPLPVKKVTFDAEAGLHTGSHHDLLYDTIAGRVTRGGEAVEAALVQIGGTRTVTRIDGRYVLPVNAKLKRVPVTVTGCDGSFTYSEVPKAPIPVGQSFDIRIPSNGLKVKVVDVATRRPIADVAVVFNAVDRESSEVTYPTATGRTDAEGGALSGPLSPHYPVLVCAEADEYQQGCSDAVDVSEDGESTVTLALQRLAWMGRVVSESSIDGGRIFLVDGSGLERESAAVAADGSFSYERKPRPGDYAVLVSRSHPLFAQRIDTDAASPLTMYLSRHAPGAIAVELSPRYPLESARVTVSVGELLIPSEVFASHMSWRGGPVVRKGRPFLIRDVVPSAPITVLVGPAVADRPPDAPPGADLFVLPQFRGHISRQLVPVDGKVVF